MFLGEELKLLRQRVPVGVRHGLVLLGQVAGNVQEAAALFEQEALALVMSKTGATEPVAEQHLRQAAFDVSRALKTIEQAQYSLTERILRRHQRHKQEAIRLIMQAVAEDRKLTHTVWLSFEELQQLPPALGCVLIIGEWLNYAGWEGLDSAMYFHLDEVLVLLDEQLQLPQVGKALRQLRHLELAQAPLRKQALAAEGYFMPAAEFERAVSAMQELEPLLVEALYSFVIQHISEFP